MEIYDQEKLFNAYGKAISDPLPELQKLFQNELIEIEKYTSIATKTMGDGEDPFNRKNGKVCDIGCGIGRPIFQLAKKFPLLFFTGFDISDKVLIPARLAAMGQDNVDIIKQNVLNIEGYEGQFDLSYSTYNVIGTFSNIEIPKLLKNQWSITRKNGIILTMGWNTTNDTTAFLKKYYPHVGLKIENMDENHTKTNVGTFRRFNSNQIMKYYLDGNIRPVEAKDIGLWYSVAGRVM